MFKETGFQDEFFDNIFNFLIGYSENAKINISEKNLLEFHLSYLVKENFLFEPKENTKKIIWQYLSSNNLLTNANDIDLDDREKIRSFEIVSKDSIFDKFSSNVFPVTVRQSP